MIDQALILAIGRGVRLGPLTKDRPRAMLPVLGKPLIVRIMDRMREAGIRRFVVIMGEYEGAVAAYLNRSWVPDVEIKFVTQAEPRGTAHAISLAAPYVDGPFLLASTDGLTSVSHISQIMRRFDVFRGDMILSVLRATDADEGRAGVIKLDSSGSRVVAFTDLPLTPRNLFAFMLHASSTRLFRYVAEHASSPASDRDLVRPIQSLINADGKVGYLAAEWRLPLVQELDLLTINKRLLREDRDTHILSEVPASVHIVPPVRIDPMVSIGAHAQIGPNVYLESGASVGEAARLWDTLVLREGTVQPGEVLHDHIVARRDRLSEEEIPTSPW